MPTSRVDRMTTGWWEKFADWAWALLVLLLGWAWRINDRITRLEMRQQANEQTLASIDRALVRLDKKLDKLVDRT